MIIIVQMIAPTYLHHHRRHFSRIIFLFSSGNQVVIVYLSGNRMVSWENI